MEALREVLVQGVSAAVLWGAVGVLLRGTLVLAGAAVVCLLLRRSSAAARHMVWTLAVAALLALPAVTVFVPWEMGVLPAVSGLNAGDALELPEAWSAVGLASPAGVAVLPGASAPAGEGAALLEGVSPAVPLLGPGGGVDAAIAPSSSIGGGQTLLALAVVVWLVGAALLFVRLLAGMVTVRLLGFQAEPMAGAEWQGLVDRLAAECGIERRVRLLRSDMTAMPMTWGVAEPVILLPVSALDWTPERKQLVLLHELAHVRRRDVLAQAAAHMACAFYWFNPLVWLATSRMRAECERACDDWVLRAGTRGSTYAEHLLEMVRSVGRSALPAPALPMARRSGFEGRLLAILEPDLERGRVTRWAVVSSAVVAVALTLLIAAMAPVRPAAAEYAAEELAMEADGVLAADEFSAVLAHDQMRYEEIDLADALADALPDALQDGLQEAWSHKVSGAAAAARDALLPRQEGSAAVAALARALADSDAGVRGAAAHALGQLEDPRAVAALSEALRRDTVAEVRRMAAWALGQIEDAAAIPALTDAIRSDADVDVRRTAVWAIGQIEAESGVEGLNIALRDSDAQVRRTAVWGIGQIESEAGVEPLLPLIRDSDVEIRRQAVWALGQIESPRAVSGLIALLANETDVDTRKQAVWALGQIEDAAAVPGLEAALRDSNVEIRKMAIWALGQIEPETAPQGLIDALRDVNAGVREAAAIALGNIEDPASAAALTVAIEDSVPQVKRAAIMALSSMDGAAAIDALVRLLQDPDPEVRRAAARALGRR